MAEEKKRKENKALRIFKSKNDCESIPGRRKNKTQNKKGQKENKLRLRVKPKLNFRLQN